MAVFVDGVSLVLGRLDSGGWQCGSEGGEGRSGKRSKEISDTRVTHESVQSCFVQSDPLCKQSSLRPHFLIQVGSSLCSGELLGFFF